MSKQRHTCEVCGDQCSFDRDSRIWRHHTNRQHAARVAEPETLVALRNFLHAFGGDIPDWLRDEADAAYRAIENAEAQF